MKGHVGGGPGPGSFKVSGARVTNISRSIKHVLSRIHYVIDLCRNGSLK